MAQLANLIEGLAGSTAVSDKIKIRQAFEPAIPVCAEDVAIGDDCAAIRESDGSYLLLAAEGMLESFVRDDPWFAGYSAVMVNVSDICAMGGRPTAVVDVLWTRDHEASKPIWDGMRAAARDYGVPIVGGHTTITGPDSPSHLAAAIVGRASRLLTSFDARPNDALLMVVDLSGGFRRDAPFWNSTQDTPPETRRKYIELLPRIAEHGWCCAAKDISNGGLVGTLIMLLDCSAVGAELILDAIPRPRGVEIHRWLVSFPSFGYLLSVRQDACKSVIDLFVENGLECSRIGTVTPGPSLDFVLGDERQTFWSLPN